MQRMAFRTQEEAERYDGVGNPVYKESGMWFIGRKPSGNAFDPGRAQPITAPQPQPGGFPPVPQQPVSFADSPYARPSPSNPLPEHGGGVGQVPHTPYVTPTSPGMPYGTIGSDGRIDYGYGPGVFPPPQARPYSTYY